MVNVRRFFFVCFLVTLIFDSGIAQPSRNEKYEISLRTKLADIDNMNRLYVVTPENAVVSFNPRFIEKFRYTNRRSGDITMINVSNPLKILIYARDFGQVIILDNTLAEVDMFTLADFGFTEISAVGVSNDDSYWLYDPLRFRLIKISRTGQILHESSNISDFGVIRPDIKKIVESGNYVILHDPKSGFYVFDNFGQYIRTLPLQQTKSFRFDGRNIFWFSDNSLKSTTINGLSIKELYALSAEELDIVRDVLYLPEGLLKLYDHGLRIELK